MELRDYRVLFLLVHHTDEFYSRTRFSYMLLKFRVKNILKKSYMAMYDYAERFPSNVFPE